MELKKRAVAFLERNWRFGWIAASYKPAIYLIYKTIPGLGACTGINDFISIGLIGLILAIPQHAFIQLIIINYL